MSEKKRVIIRRFDGVYCLVLVHKNPANPAHWVFDVMDLPIVGGYNAHTYKRYASGNYYWVDTFFGGVHRVRIKEWFPAWDLHKILAAHDKEVFR